MIANNRGHIINIASSAGLFGVSKLVDYSTSKFAAVGIHESLNSELSTLNCDGVHCLCVCPYFIDTGMFDGVKTRYVHCIFGSIWVVCMCTHTHTRSFTRAYTCTHIHIMHMYKHIHIMHMYKHIHTHTHTHTHTQTCTCTRAHTHTHKIVIFVVCFFRVPALLPILKPDYVVNKIMSAFHSNRNMILLPKILYLFLFLQS